MSDLTIFDPPPLSPWEFSTHSGDGWRDWLQLSDVERAEIRRAHDAEGVVYMYWRKR